MGIIAFWIIWAVLSAGLTIYWEFYRPVIQRRRREENREQQNFTLLNYMLDALINWVDAPRPPQQPPLMSDDLKALHSAIDVMLRWDELPPLLRLELQRAKFESEIRHRAKLMNQPLPEQIPAPKEEKGEREDSSLYSLSL